MRDRILMSKLEKLQEGFQYSEEVRNAVRYGYLYRKEAEESHTVHACLSDSPELLQYLASAIISGFVWDVVKSLAKKLYRFAKKSGMSIDDMTKSVLTDEEHFEEFYNCIKEYNTRCMTITEEQFKYIREEIVADYSGKEAGKIYEKETRLPTTEEYMRITTEANAYADNVMMKIG
jgi:hypothetical protein